MGRQKAPMQGEEGGREERRGRAGGGGPLGTIHKPR